MDRKDLPEHIPTLAELYDAVGTELPLSIDVSPDVRVLSFTMLVTCGTAIVFGLLPALRAARIDPLPALKVSGGPGRGGSRIPLRRALVVTQIAMSVILLVTAGLYLVNRPAPETTDPLLKRPKT